jgi:hippurate hydrolase
MFRYAFTFLFLLLFLSLPAQNKKHIKKYVPELTEIYKHLHQNPELSYMEKNTAKFLSEKMRKFGFEVTENFGGTSIVAILKNGKGPKILIRTDMDALPILEKTGLPYASKVKQKDIDGIERPVMHACGHDMHMTVWLGVAKYLSEHKDEWKGTLMMIGQQAEERGGGSIAMLNEDLYQKFFLPDYALAIHIRSDKPAGTLSYCPGYAMANVDMAEITFRGRGGHGAYPHTTIDPIAMSALFINDVQHIVSREIAPVDPAVITIGSIHGGTKGNVIPSEVKLELTIRSYKDEVRNHLIEGIKRKAKAAAMSFNIPEDKYPVFKLKDVYTPALYNHPDLVETVIGSMKEYFGEDKIMQVPPTMGGEDFGRFGKTKEKVPIFMFFLHTLNPEKYKEYKQKGITPPSLHSDSVVLDPEPSIETGVQAMVNAVLSLQK